MVEEDEVESKNSSLAEIKKRFALKNGWFIPHIHEKYLPVNYKD